VNESTRSAVTSAARRRIIIVDDNYAVADGLRWALESAGHTVVGMASSIETAMELVVGTACDVAILDIDLHGKTTETIARQLAALSIPFMTITGFGDTEDLPPELAGAPRLEKPADLEEILRIIAALCPTSG
jgi:DNA-binding response OmpR family regulator